MGHKWIGIHAPRWWSVLSLHSRQNILEPYGLQPLLCEACNPRPVFDVHKMTAKKNLAGLKLKTRGKPDTVGTAVRACGRRRRWPSRWRWCSGRPPSSPGTQRRTSGHWGRGGRGSRTPSPGGIPRRRCEKMSSIRNSTTIVGLIRGGIASGRWSLAEGPSERSSLPGARRSGRQKGAANWVKVLLRAYFINCFSTSNIACGAMGAGRMPGNGCCWAEPQPPTGEGSGPSL